jgi:hypothetical protein
MLPWLITGIFIIAPPQVYLERLNKGEFSGSFFQFFPHYFEGVYGFGGNFAFHGMHLWYLMQLSIFSLITLPLLLPRKSSTSIMSKSGQILDKPWLLPFLFLTLIIPLIITNIAGLEFTEQMGSWDIMSYLAFFLLGYILFSRQGFLDSIKSQGLWFLTAAVVISVGHLVLDFNIRPDWYDGELRGPGAWAWIIGLLWLGQRLLNFNNRFVGYANEEVLPFYILHQTVILTVGFFVVQSSIGILPKYVLTAATSFILILAVYELAIRRVNILRFLFGMRSKSR